MTDEAALISPEDEALYRGVLDEIYKRDQVMRAHVPRLDANGDMRLQRPEVEFCALQLRMTIELIAMSSLVTNRRAIEEAEAVLESTRKPSEAAKVAKAANPNYWPRALRVEEVAEGKKRWLDEERALAEDRWAREWGALSALLHARNPYREPVGLTEASELIDRVSNEVVRLMNHHQVRLADRTGVLIGQIGPDGASVTHFTLVL